MTKNDELYAGAARRRLVEDFMAERVESDSASSDYEEMVAGAFEQFRARSIEPLPAAILTLASIGLAVAGGLSRTAIQVFKASPVGDPDRFGHELCLAIRYGLAGSGARNDSVFPDEIAVRVKDSDPLAGFKRPRQPEIPGATLQTTIAELRLSVRATNVLETEGIHAISDLLKYSEGELRELRNFGDTTMAEVRRALQRYGLKLPVNPSGRITFCGIALEP